MSFEPVCDNKSRVLILGTYPSPLSRAAGFYYGHPQNRFWKLLAALTQSEVPKSIEEKKAMLLQNRIAIWDVCHSCEIDGAKDASIRAVVSNDIAAFLLQNPNITHVYCNGAKAYELCLKSAKEFPVPVTKLPSTSPANAQFQMDRLMESWKVIL